MAEVVTLSNAGAFTMFKTKASLQRPCGCSSVNVVASIPLAGDQKPPMNCVNHVQSNNKMCISAATLLGLKGTPKGCDPLYILNAECTFGDPLGYCKYEPLTGMLCLRPKVNASLHSTRGH